MKPVSKLRSIMATIGSCRCCVVPLGVAASAIVTSYLIGNTLPNSAAEHVGSDLLVATAAVVVHLSLQEMLKRLRTRSRHRKA